MYQKGSSIFSKRVPQRGPQLRRRGCVRAMPEGSHWLRSVVQQARIRSAVAAIGSEAGLAGFLARQAKPLSWFLDLYLTRSEGSLDAPQNCLNPFIVQVGRREP